MSGVCGHENRCGDWRCPYTVCDGCPITEALDAAGIKKAESFEQVMKAIDGYIKPKPKTVNMCFREGGAW